MEQLEKRVLCVGSWLTPNDGPGLVGQRLSSRLADLPRLSISSCCKKKVVATIVGYRDDGRRLAPSRVPYQKASRAMMTGMFLSGGLSAKWRSMSSAPASKRSKHS